MPGALGSQPSSTSPLLSSLLFSFRFVTPLLSSPLLSSLHFSFCFITPPPLLSSTLLHLSSPLFLFHPPSSSPSLYSPPPLLSSPLSSTLPSSPLLSPPLLSSPLLC